MAKAKRGEVSLYISPLVLAEISGMLKSFARYSMTAIVRVIISLVSAPGIEGSRRGRRRRRSGNTFRGLRWTAVAMGPT
jgi:hypothetical protein